MRLPIRLALPLAAALVWLLYFLAGARPDADGEHPDGGDPSGPADLDQVAAAPTAAPHDPVEPRRPPPEPDSEEGRHQTATQQPDTDLDGPGEGLSLAGLARRKAFLAEERDAPWAEATEGRLTERMGSLKVRDGHFEAAACRASLCRLTFQFDHEAALPDNPLLFDDLRRMFGMDLAAERHALPDGRQRVTAYVKAKP